MIDKNFQDAVSMGLQGYLGIHFLAAIIASVPAIYLTFKNMYDEYIAKKSTDQTEKYMAVLGAIFIYNVFFIFVLLIFMTGTLCFVYDDVPLQFKWFGLIFSIFSFAGINYHLYKFWSD